MNDKKKILIEMLATVLGAGFIKKAPGTFGSLTAFPVAYILTLFFPTALSLLVAAVLFIVIFYFVGVWSADQFDKIHGTQDSKQIVIDELVGQMIALLPIFWLLQSPSLILWTLSFVLFRFFDILKPPPIKQIDEKVKNGHGVMLDDVLAGLMAAICIIPVLFILGYV